MDQRRDERRTLLPTSMRRAGVVALAVGGLVGSAFGGVAVGAATNHAAKSVVISTAKNAKLGTILVSGTTVYVLKPSKTACTATCLKTWPEVVLPAGVTEATVGAGVSASKLGTVTLAGGIRQVTYAGKALYKFSEDKSAGQVKGNGTDKWGAWAAIVTVKPSTTSTTTGSGATTTTAPGTGGISF